MKESIREEITDFVLSYHDQHSTVTVWGSPIVGFASASDSMFNTLKSAVSESHAMPAELLHNAQTVVAFFLPFTEETARTNIAGETSSWEWARAYVETNKLIHDLSLHMQAFLSAHHHQSAITPATHNYDTDKLISDWSHRHIAFTTGIGRLGLNNMLITEQGCCGRVGSFVTSARVEPDPQRQQEACLYRYNGECMKCVERCVNNALSKDKFDRHKCHEMCLQNGKLFLSLGKTDVCGKCLVGIPCSHIDPVQKMNA
ncbi:epoxyqueuosine reductase [Candidatus Acetothermia bacterium]|nr:epoxyqueuosine reductase [Candidatus Acetothermia bacterium]